MPILPPEPDFHPSDLFALPQGYDPPDDDVDVDDSDVVVIRPPLNVPPPVETNAADGDDNDEQPPAWYLVYTRSRQEKTLMRHLRQLNITHYGPQVPKRNRDKTGRIRTSRVPMFANYLFMYGTNSDRYRATCTGCILKTDLVEEREQLETDLRQIHDLIAMEVPMTIEARLEPGRRVRIRNGSFAGYEGVVTRRDQEVRLIVSVRFMDSGVSVKLDDCQVEAL